MSGDDQNKLRSSSEFRFKQFVVSNRHSAQKVGTDGVITGAAAGNTADAVSTIWDVGAGTGLIALMLAQRHNGARITAIEIDPVAAAECRDNIAASPWGERIGVVEGDVNEACRGLDAPDMIVSNPPFFSSAGESAPDRRRALARQDGSLNPISLIQLASQYLATGGCVVFISPYDRNDEIELVAELSRMQTVEVLDIASRSDKEPIRRLWTMKRRGETEVRMPKVSRLDIRLSVDGYPFSDEYRRLTGDFYLDF